MRISATMNLNYSAILDARGLGKDQKAAKFLASQVERFSDKRVPFRKGTLKNQVRILAENGEVCLHYVMPYAHYHYHGEVMAGRAPKHYTGKAISHHGAPLRGPKWDERTMEAEGDAIVRSFAKYVGGEAT